MAKAAWLKILIRKYIDGGDRLRPTSPPMVPHTAGFAAATGSLFGDKKAMHAYQILGVALTGLMIIPHCVQAVKQEFHNTTKKILNP